MAQRVFWYFYLNEYSLKCGNCDMIRPLIKITICWPFDFVIILRSFVWSKLLIFYFYFDVPSFGAVVGVINELFANMQSCIYILDSWCNYLFRWVSFVLVRFSFTAGITLSMRHLLLFNLNFKTLEKKLLQWNFIHESISNQWIMKSTENLHGFEHMCTP